MDRFDTSENGRNHFCECAKCGIEIDLDVDDTIDNGDDSFCEECGREEVCADCEEVVGADNLNEDCVCEACAEDRKFSLKVDAYQQKHQEGE